MRLRRRKTNGASAKALEDAQLHVREASDRNPEVYELGGQLRRSRERNHFAEQIYRIMSPTSGKGV